VVNHRHFGGSTAHQAPEPVPSVARLFSRPPSSVLAKLANLDGSRSHGARWNVLAGAMLRDDPAQCRRLYRVLLPAARPPRTGPASARTSPAGKTSGSWPGSGSKRSTTPS
jgi:putative restriction endonuclease